MEEQEPNDLVDEYASLFLESLNDPVAFAENFLGFHPYPYQEEFLRDPSPLIVACCGRQVGKTTLTAVKALHFALGTRSVRILIVSAGLRQSMILFDKILEFIELAIPAKTLLRYRSRTKVQFLNGSEIVALPCGRDGSTLRGFTADMVILDECNFIPAIVIDSVIRPTMITRPDARLVMLSTPWMKDHPFYEALTKPELGFKAYVWPTSMNPQITKERLELERRTIGEQDFNREYNAFFQDDQFAYFPSTLVLTCTDDYQLNPDPMSDERLHGEFFVGIDFGKHADHTAIAIVERVSEKDIRLVYLKQFELNTPYAVIIAFVKRLHETYQFTSGSLDQTGVGEGPYEAIRAFMPSMKGVTLTAPVKEDILGKLRLQMEARKLTLPRDHTPLLTQITSQQAEPMTSGRLKFYHPTGTKDDQLWALALAIHATVEQGSAGILMPVKRRL